jgi:hypothetical protein
MVKLLEDAVDAPPEMRAFVAAQFRESLRSRGAGARPTADDAALLRRFVFSKGGDANLTVTRAEAELLFDFNDAAAAGEADPAWTEFFVKAIAAHLMADLAYEPLSRDEARRLHEFASDRSVNVGGFFSRMISGGLSALSGGKDQPVAARRALAREAAARTAETVTSDESEWLAERIGKDGSFTDSERRLLAYLGGLGAELPANLKALIERAA